MSCRRDHPVKLRKAIVCFYLILLGQAPVHSKEVPARQDAAVFQRAAARGIAFLRKSQNPDGSFSSELGPGVTSLVTTSLLRHGIPERDPVVSKALEYLEGFVQSDGGIYKTDSIYRNYETCLAMLCFAELKQERFQRYLTNAEAFIKKIQWDEDEGQDPSSPAYGGAGYGNQKRPDLSNTSFLIEALKAAGVSDDDEALQRALIFVSRCQNLETHHNTLPFNNKNPDGGFYYTGAAGGTSQAGNTASGGLRSYGSMTYAGLKSMIYAGVDASDTRVKAAIGWISNNYDLSRNPGMPSGRDGLYYYYHTFAKALQALGEDRIQDAEGIKHDWRAELLQTLASQQQENGSWVNESPRWLEGDAELVTAYALLSLSYCKK